jgi:cholesterol oxidase
MQAPRSENAVSQRFDAIVVGSGFGGAVVSCRLAESGARVLVLERGRRWTKDQYPRKPGDAWLFDPRRPERRSGWLDLRFFKGMAILMGAGVGGGSLCYSSVVIESDAERFREGWPPEITAAELVPYAESARRMLGVQPIPPTQQTQRSKLLRQGAEKLGLGGRFFSAPLAVSFDPEWNYDLADPLDPRHSKPFVNPQGRQQGTCIHLGNCDIGCDVHAKNTLDLNYLATAEQRGAEVRPLHIVRCLEPQTQGYCVTFDRIEGGRLIRGSEDVPRVVLAAGSLGSTELLLRCRDEYGTLPRVSKTLGCDWSPNANVLTPDVYRSAAIVRQSVGPTISAGLDFSDGDVGGHRFILEDDGFPNLLLNAVTAKLRSSWLPLFGWALRSHLRRSLDEANPLANVEVWLGAGVDAGNGRLSLRRSWLTPWRKELRLDWKVKRSEGVIEAILDMQRRLSAANGGRLRVPLYWSLLKALVTVHPLGGCKMGSTHANGVVDHRGEVFGYPGLYVADGAILPLPVGRNPSLTIAALAERVARLMIRDGPR